MSASDVDQKSEGKVEPAAEEKQVEAPAQNVVEAVPASESDKSTGMCKKMILRRGRGCRKEARGRRCR